jgi:hypothetical protein
MVLEQIRIISNFCIFCQWRYNDNSNLSQYHRNDIIACIDVLEGYLDQVFGP